VVFGVVVHCRILDALRHSSWQVVSGGEKQPLPDLIPVPRGRSARLVHDGRRAGDAIAAGADPGAVRDVDGHRGPRAAAVVGVCVVVVPARGLVVLLAVIVVTVVADGLGAEAHPFWREAAGWAGRGGRGEVDGLGGDRCSWHLEGRKEVWYMGCGDYIWTGTVVCARGRL